jgi:hypothetical protein
VNVSYRQFLGEDLTEHVRAALAESGLPGTALELEFTERVLIEDAPDTVRTFAALRDLGVVLTIDDFGEGYSALNYPAPTADPRAQAQSAVRAGRSGSHLRRGRLPGGHGHRRAASAWDWWPKASKPNASAKFLLDLGVTIGQGFLFSPGPGAGGSCNPSTHPATRRPDDAGMDGYGDRSAR